MGKSMYELKDMLCEELEKITEQGELTPGSLDIVDKLTHSIKSIDTILAMDEAGYSNDGRMYDDRRSYGGSYDDRSYDGNSYARGRGRYARRDSMGRYSRDGRSYDRRGYSRDDAKDELMEHLEEMEKMAKDEETRRMVSQWKRQVEKD